MYIVVYLLTHELGARGKFELATRIKEVVANQKCPINSYNLGDTATQITSLIMCVYYSNM